MSRLAEIRRTTRETDVRVSLELDGSGTHQVETGVGFFDHLLASLAHHALFDLTIATEGDLHIDDHHTVEDTALALGEALDAALGDRSGITRFGHAQVPGQTGHLGERTMRRLLVTVGAEGVHIADDSVLTRRHAGGHADSPLRRAKHPVKTTSMMPRVSPIPSRNPGVFLQ